MATASLTLRPVNNLPALKDRIYEQLMAEELNVDVRDRIAYFAIYNQLKRLWDQAKNICEETIFLVSGETKPRKVHNVLFIDEDNAGLSQMAEAIANMKQ